MEYSAVSTIWIMVGTVLIFFMQAGFAMLETGMTRVIWLTIVSVR